MQVIFLSAFIFGSLDISCTLVVNQRGGVAWTRTLQFVASGLLGRKAFEGGSLTASLGLLIHFLISVVVSAIYYLASLKIPLLIQHPCFWGAVYGIAVYLFMTFIVLPLSKVRRPFSWKRFAIQSAIHIFCVGLPGALVISFFRN